MGKRPQSNIHLDNLRGLTAMLASVSSLAREEKESSLIKRRLGQTDGTASWMLITLRRQVGLTLPLVCIAINHN